MFKMVVVIRFPRTIKLPATLSLGSLFILILLVSLTNPLNSVVAVALFFIFFTIFVVSFGYSFMSLQGNVSKESQRRFLMAAATFILIVMLRSAKALNLLDTGLMIVFFLGLTFYINRR